MDGRRRHRSTFSTPSVSRFYNGLFCFREGCVREKSAGGKAERNSSSHEEIKKGIQPNLVQTSATSSDKRGSLGGYRRLLGKGLVKIYRHILIAIRPVFSLSRFFLILLQFFLIRSGVLIGSVPSVFIIFFGRLLCLITHLFYFESFCFS